MISANVEIQIQMSKSKIGPKLGGLQLPQTPQLFAEQISGFPRWGGWIYMSKDLQGVAPEALKPLEKPWNASYPLKKPLNALEI